MRLLLRPHQRFNCIFVLPDRFLDLGDLLLVRLVGLLRPHRLAQGED
jgi:hypothetical protein